MQLVSGHYQLQRDHERLLSLKEVLKVLGVSKTQFYQLMNSELFPRPIRLPLPNSKKNYWREKHVMLIVKMYGDGNSKEKIIEEVRRINSQVS